MLIHYQEMQVLVRCQSKLEPPPRTVKLAMKDPMFLTFQSPIRSPAVPSLFQKFKSPQRKKSPGTASHTSHAKDGVSGV